MAFSKQTIKSKSEDIGGNMMALAASSLEQDASEDEVRESVAKIVAKMLDELPGIITWWISDDWAAKLVARITDAFGKTLLDWLR
jgi:hypothetical protein